MFNEQQCDWGLALELLVESIAVHKMAHAALPQGAEGETAYVVTADTLSQNTDGGVEGKPTDRADAKAKLIKVRDGARLATAFCLDLKRFEKGQWQTDKRIVHVVTATYRFIVPDHWLDAYLDNSIGQVCANALAVETYGAQFLHTMQGSYTTIIGLPMFELRLALEELGFFS